MRARLAFAISTHVETDILLLDEVVATGDAGFFRKANQKLEDFARESKILVLASHSNRVLRELCNKAVMLEHGRIKAFGSIDEVIEIYMAAATGGRG
jgi:ABC-type polysaccharide/polyol phosphate transport system ATPase subunit